MVASITSWPRLPDRQASTQAPWRSNATTQQAEPHRQSQGSQALFDTSEPDILHQPASIQSGPGTLDAALYSQQHRPARDMTSSTSSPSIYAVQSQLDTVHNRSANATGSRGHPPTAPASQRLQVQNTASRTPWSVNQSSPHASNTVGRHDLQANHVPSQWSNRAQTQRLSRLSGPAPVLDQSMFRSPHAAGGRVESPAQNNLSNVRHGSDTTSSSAIRNEFPNLFDRLSLGSSTVNGRANVPNADHFNNRSFQSRTLTRINDSHPASLDGTASAVPSLFDNFSGTFSSGSTRSHALNGYSSYVPTGPAGQFVTSNSIQSTPTGGTSGLQPSWPTQQQQAVHRLNQLYTEPIPPSYIQSYQYHNGTSDLNQPFPSPLPAPLPGDGFSGFATRSPYEELPTMRSALLQSFRDKGKSTSKWELKELVGHIVEFSGDHNGSMFIQSKIKEAKSEEKELVFNEVQHEAVPLMKDVFGNYVMQKFFEYGDQEQKRILVEKMRGRVAELSKDTYGCRVIQAAVQNSLSAGQRMMLYELQPAVMELIRNENGNHVIQACIRTVKIRDLHECITDQFFGHVRFLSTHRYGCRIIQRMLEHCDDVVKDRLMEELRTCMEELISDQFGNYVPQHIIEKRSVDRCLIIRIVLHNLVHFSKQKYASNVVEKCVQHGSVAQKREIAQEMMRQDHLQNGELLTFLIRDGFGNYVIQSLLDHLPDEDFSTFLDRLSPAYQKARLLGQNKQTDNVGRKMQRLANRHGWNAASGPSHRFGSVGSAGYGIRAGMHAPAQINTQVPRARPADVPTPPLTVGGSESPRSSSGTQGKGAQSRELTPESPDGPLYPFHR